MRAVIDIGTNSVLMLLGRREPSGAIEIISDDARVARLGQDVAKTGQLRADAIERTLEILAAYKTVAGRAGATIVAVATEGLRLASNRDAFLSRAAHVLGVDVRMISGDEEAELSYRSVAAESPPDQPLRVFDIGGASTELVVGRGLLVESRRSHPVGSVRLTEQFVDEDPPSRASIEAIEAETRRVLSAQPVSGLDVIHGVAGTVTTCAALLLGLSAYDRDRVHGCTFGRAAIAVLRDDLARQTIAQRLTLPCLPRGRADVIVAGLTILLASMDHCGATKLAVRDRGLRYALL